MLYEFASTEWINEFRERTERNSTMTGVTFPTFMCKKCKTNRSTVGRKHAVKGYPKHGYICAECAKGK